MRYIQLGTALLGEHEGPAGREGAQGNFQKKFSGGRCYKKTAVANSMNNLPQFWEFQEGITQVLTWS